MNDTADNANTSNPQSVADQNATQTPEILDLDGVSNFKFQGETYTPDRFTEIFQGYQKYGEASKYVEEDKTYWSNVDHDIEKVLKDPSRIDEFKQIYPERFHKYLDRALGSNRRVDGNPSQSSQNTGPNSKDLEALVEKLVQQRLQPVEQRLHSADVQAANAKIEAILPPLLNKYELADENRVLMEAEKQMLKGYKITDSAWERLVKEDHERTQKRADKFYEAKLKTQIQKGQKGQDIGSGGATPGQAPMKPKTFAEAEAAMIAHLRSQRN